MKAWKQLDSKFVVADRWVRLRADTCELGNGKSIGPYYVMEESDWVHVVALTPAGDVVTVRQYRYAGGAVCLELPAGVVDAGEDPLTAAMRELKEETGRSALRWAHVGSVFANPARQTNKVHVYLATQLDEGGPQKLDESEDIEHEVTSISELKKAIRLGEFSQSMHIASFYMATELM